MTSADKIIYNTTDPEVTIPLNNQDEADKFLQGKESRCNSRKCMLFTALGVAVALTASSLGYYFGVAKPEKINSKPRYTYKRTVVSNTTALSMTTQSLSSSSSDSMCSVSQSSVSSQTNIVPMPHQLVLCQDQNYCNGNYILVSLYDYSTYIDNAQTLLLYDWEAGGFASFQDSNIHSYSQGKYIASQFTESKVDQSNAQQLFQAIASYAITQVEEAACKSLEKVADGIPLCGIVKFVAWVGSYWDLGNNAPSSQSGKLQTYLSDLGLGGNVNTAYVQFYDPYNYPSATFFEYGDCTQSSGTYGARQFNTSGTATNPVLNQYNATSYGDASQSISYPAQNADSVMVPMNMYVTLYQDGKFVQNITNICKSSTCSTQTCFSIDGFFNQIVVGYGVDYETYGVTQTEWMYQNYLSCMDNPLNTEQWCAAQDKCLEENNFSWAACPDSVVPNYENPAWVSGNCGDN